MPLANYVKFQRGSKSAYENLGTRADADTLYFVSDADSTTWDLYLGIKHVGVTSGGTGPSEISLGDITNVDLTGAKDGSLLGYDSATNKWIPVDKDSLGTPAQVFEVTPEENETENAAVVRITNGKSNIGDLILVSVNGNINTWVHSGNDAVGAKFTKLTQEFKATDIIFDKDIGTGDGSLDVNGKSLTEVITVINEKINNTYTKEETDTKITSEISKAVADAGHLKRVIKNSVADIDLTVDDADQYIYLVPNADNEDGNKYDEYIVIDGMLEKVGDWKVNLDDYVQKVEGKDLSTNDYTDEDKAKVQESEKNIINSVDENEFQIVTGQVGELNLDRQLQIKSIDVAKIGNLTDQVVKIIKGEVGNLDLYDRLEKVETSIDLGVDSDNKPILVNAKIGTLETLIINNTEKINELDSRLTWNEIAESSTT